MLTLNKRQLLIVGILILLAFAPLVAYAQNAIPTIVPCSGAQANAAVPGSHPCGVCDIATLIQNILNAAIFISVFLSAILFAWAGLKMVMSPASSSQSGKAKTLFTNVLIGFIIIMGAWLIVNAIMSILFTGTYNLRWNRIC